MELQTIGYTSRAEAGDPKSDRRAQVFRMLENGYHFEAPTIS